MSAEAKKGRRSWLPLLPFAVFAGLEEEILPIVRRLQAEAGT